MQGKWNCPQCGSHGYHYSQNRKGMVCDQCGYLINNEKQHEEDMDYDRNLAMAREYLQVGEWEKCKQIIKPLCSKKPSDKQLYLILLAATTRGYEDYLFVNPLELAEAANYWDKLEKLRCVNSVMKEYGRKRLVKKEELRSLEMTCVLIVLCVCILLTIITFILCASGNMAGIAFAFLTIVVWICGIKMFKKKHNPLLFTKNAVERGMNPFQ